ncbi:MAG: hypothetical protein WAK16_13245 [Candidatus Cybelea sp.]|jgi:hypothetical protein
MRFLSIPLLAVAAAMLITGCNGKSSSNSSDQTSASATAAASAAGGAGTTASGTDQIPSYPGAVTQAAGSSDSMGGAASAAGKVMSTDDSFDKVYAWYQQNMPAGSEKAHTTSPVQSAVFTIGETKDQTSVTITTQGTKTMISVAHVKM